MVYVCIWEKDWDGVMERLEWPQECTIGLYHEDVYKQFWYNFDDAWDMIYEEMAVERERQHAKQAAGESNDKQYEEGAGAGSDNQHQNQDTGNDEADDVPDPYDEAFTIYNKFELSPLWSMQIDPSVSLGQYIDTLQGNDVTVIAFYIVVNMTQSVDKHDLSNIIDGSKRVSLTCRKLGLHLHPDRHPKYSEFVQEVYKGVNNIKSLFDSISATG